MATILLHAQKLSIYKKKFVIYIDLIYKMFLFAYFPLYTI